jgi:hypothetical protein
MTSQTAGNIKFTTILAAVGDDMKWYSTPETMPPGIRRTFELAMAGPHRDTVVIANEEARQHVTENLGKLETEPPRKSAGMDLHLALDLSLLGLLGLALWCLAMLR